MFCCDIFFCAAMVCCTDWVLNGPKNVNNFMRHFSNKERFVTVFYFSKNNKI